MGMLWQDIRYGHAYVAQQSRLCKYCGVDSRASASGPIPLFSVSWMSSSFAPFLSPKTETRSCRLVSGRTMRRSPMGICLVP